MKKIFVLIGLLLFVSLAYAQEDETVWMPDANLRQLVREMVELPDDVPLTKLELKRLKRLTQFSSDVSDITGLEHATNLEELVLTGSHITDLVPIEGLTRLTRLIIAWNRTRLADISPLATLTNLQHLDLNWNAIIDISPLANLIHLETLKMRHNQIQNITSLTELTKLTHLDLIYNYIVDFSPVLHLQLVVFEYDEVCELPRLSIRERIDNRNFPSIISAWGNIENSPVFNRSELSNMEQVALHDLYFGSLFPIMLFGKNEESRVVRFVEDNREIRDTLLELNPNMLFIQSIELRQAHESKHPEDWSGWFRDASGERVRNLGLNHQAIVYFIDFTQPEAIDWIVGQAIAISHCGLYDGIFFDYWSEDTDIILHPDAPSPRLQTEAKLEIVRKIRDNVNDNFLILGNTGLHKRPLTAPYINGGWMEAGKDYPEGFTHAGLIKREDTLTWLEKNTREPRINALEADGIHLQSPESELNKKWMRVITTLTLTHSDGYVSYTTGIRGNLHDHSIVKITEPVYNQNHYKSKHQSNVYHTHDHEHYFYEFWDADLGKPIGEKAHFYENREGVFIREFTNGWAVYNRSYAEQTIDFSVPVKGVSSGKTNLKHTLSDLDGEMYLKINLDLNGDGKVNILDLVIIANAFGKAEPDLNGDGVVNILDLVIIANSFTVE